MRRLLPLAPLVIAIAAACGDDDESAPVPRPPPTLALAAISSAGGPRWTPESGATCVEIGTDPAGTILVEVSKNNFDLRPPGACGSLRPCGTVAVLLDGAVVAQAATTAVSVPFAGDAGAGLGSRTFRVEFRDHVGEPVLDKEQKLIADEVTLEVRAPGGCDGASDGGPDAAPDATVDATVDAAPDAAEAGVDGGSDAEAGTVDAADGGG